MSDEEKNLELEESSEEEKEEITATTEKDSVEEESIDVEEKIETTVNDDEQSEEVQLDSQEDIEEEISMDIPTIPSTPKFDELETEEQMDTEVEISTEEVAEVQLEEESFEVKEKKPVKKKKKAKQKKTLPFIIGFGIGLIVAVTAEILFSIPAWNNGTSSPDLYYIEMVIILITLMLPGLLTRSIQRGLIGAVLIFAIAFGLPFLAIPAGIVILNPLTPLFSSTDFALDAYDIFQSLFNIQFDFSVIQKWIWIIDLIIMFILMVVVVTIASALIKNISFPKKKAKHWVAIPLLSLGLIVFTIFTPIVYSSTYGIIQASTSFLAGSTQLSNAYGIFQGNVLDMETQNLEVEALLLDSAKWFGISELNYQGLRNIGIINLAVLISGQYGPLI
ncbi:MAG: hypothetical protein ACFFDW_12850, partial [Candidatus Thorarchaeota archaeon]